MTKAHILAIAAAPAGVILTAPILSSSLAFAQDRTINVPSDDPVMNAAIGRARARLGIFWEHLKSPGPGESHFSLKVMVRDGDKTEHFWVVDIERGGNAIFGRIDNDPDTVTTVKIGQRIPINEADISDWLFVRNGKMVGNETLRVLFKYMSAEEVARFRAMMEPSTP